METEGKKDDSTENNQMQPLDVIETVNKKRASSSYKSLLLYLSIYLSGVSTLLLIIADPWTMSTYISDKSLLPGLVNREFSLKIEAEYYLRDLEKLTFGKQKNGAIGSNPQVSRFFERELDNFGLEVYKQNFYFKDQNHSQQNGTNIYSIIRGERSTSSESVVLCAPYKLGEETNTLPSVALSLAIAKYFSTKSYWAKDVIVLFTDHDHHGVSAWLDSYHDIDYKFRSKTIQDPTKKQDSYYDSLADRSGPIQAAVVLEMYSREFTRMNIKIQGMFGQLPNLDLFNLVVELAARESVTPYFHDKTIPFGLSNGELYQHHLETAVSFIKTQATMQSDGLHGLFLSYAIQSLTLECPLYKPTRKSQLMSASLLSAGRLVEGVFRSLNNLTERFNRSFYFYIIVSLRRFTSIGYYMIGFGLLIAPILLKGLRIYYEDIEFRQTKRIGPRAIVLIAFALIMSILSTINISSAIILSVIIVPILIFI